MWLCVSGPFRLEKCSSFIHFAGQQDLAALGAVYYSTVWLDHIVFDR